jgi:hypothetical protein
MSNDFRVGEQSREHDWTQDPTGESYLSRLSSRYGPALQQRLELFNRGKLEPAIDAASPRRCLACEHSEMLTAAMLRTAGVKEHQLILDLRYNSGVGSARSEGRWWCRLDGGQKRFSQGSQRLQPNARWVNGLSGRSRHTIFSEMSCCAIGGPDLN